MTTRYSATPPARVSASHRRLSMRSMQWARALARRATARPLRALGVFIGAAAAVVLAAFLLTLPFVHLHAPPASFVVVDRSDSLLADIGFDADSGFGYWPMPVLPPRVAAATLALEDRRFWSHPGVDPVAIVRALRQNWRNDRRISGASTIAMQVVRLQQPAARTYLSKLKEAWLALALTARYGREAVLAHYLRIAPYANRAHGIAYAAQRYLSKPVGDLSWAEIAFLSAIPQAPSKMNPFRAPGRSRAIERGQRILTVLHGNGVITPAELTLAREQLAQLDVSAPRPRPDGALHALLQLERVVTQQRAALVAQGRFVLTTTLDLNLQRAIEDIANRSLTLWEAKGADNAAVIVLERGRNAVRTWIGSRGYFADAHGGAIDFTRVKRSPGSVLKPFIYALALERGHITPTTIMDDLPIGAEGIANSDRTYLGPMLPRQALSNSRNAPAAVLLKTIGADEGYSFLHELGLHNNERPARYYGLGVSVGALPATLEEVVGAYAVLANDGERRDFIWVEQQAAPAAKRLLSPATARQINLFLSDPIARLPSFPRMGTTEYSFPVAVKTGTSQGYRDGWTIAYSAKYLVGVWVGHRDARPMHNLTGAGSAADIAQQTMRLLHRREHDGLDDLAFPPPPGYVPVKVCALSGKRANGVCAPVFEEWFPPSQLPHEHDDVHQRVVIDSRNGQLAHADTPRAFAESRVFLQLPPRYADWATASGLPLMPAVLSSLDRGRGTRPVLLPAQFATTTRHQLQIVAPENAAQIFRDPEAPAGLNTIALSVIVTPKVEQVVWYIDGEPYAVVPFPYTARWAMTPGEHTIQARLPYGDARSAPVRVRVR